MTKDRAFLKNIIERENSIANVMTVYVDIVSYSQRPPSRQLSLVRSFMKILSHSLNETARDYIDEMAAIGTHLKDAAIILPSGDGAAIVFPFNHIPDIHLKFISILWNNVENENNIDECPHFKKNGWCKCHDKFILRGGVSEGRSILYEDLNRQFNIAGTPINMAARVMNLASPGQIMFTEDGFRSLMDMRHDLEDNFIIHRNCEIKHRIFINTYQYVQERDTPKLSTIESAQPPILTTAEQNDYNIVFATPNKYSEYVNKMVRIPPSILEYKTQNRSNKITEITRPYFIAATLVTQDIYKSVMNHNPSQFTGEQRPVENVSWISAVEFCNRMSLNCGFEPVYNICGNHVTIDYSKSGYRLPTEAEWQFSCNGNSQRDEYSPIERFAWYNSNSHGHTNDVMLLEHNAFGIYDILGNTWEWCNDWYSKNFDEFSETDYAGPKFGQEKIRRGGSWRDLAQSITPSHRSRSPPSSRESVNGFRIVLKCNE